VVEKRPHRPAKLGDFGGIDQNGIARGLLFPASLAFSKDGSSLYVSNLTLFLPYAGAKPPIDSAWTLQVKGYTVSRLPAKIPSLASVAQAPVRAPAPPSPPQASVSIPAPPALPPQAPASSGGYLLDGQGGCLKAYYYCPLAK
jgi:hypothetical protein